MKANVRARRAQSEVGRAIREAEEQGRFDGFAAAAVQLETAVYSGVDPLQWLRRALAAVDEARAA